MGESKKSQKSSNSSSSSSFNSNSKELSVEVSSPSPQVEHTSWRQLPVFAWKTAELIAN